MKRAILTGIRVNEEPTIGNYLGAYLPMIRLAQEYAGEYEINMFVPDLHSFTTPINHSKLYDQIIKGVKYYIAAGLDVENPHIHVYRQSHVPSHCERFNLGRIIQLSNSHGCGYFIVRCKIYTTR